MNIIIRQEREADFDTVYEVVKTAFENAEITDGDEANLVNRLRKGEAFIPALSLVAEVDGRIVGHILFTKLKIGTHEALALAPVSVLPLYQGNGIGGALITKGHEIAKELGYTAAIVLGHPNYYPRFGYKRASEFNIKAPFEVSDKYFMAKELIENGLKGIEGTVAYAKEFFNRQGRQK